MPVEESTPSEGAGPIMDVVHRVIQDLGTLSEAMNASPHADENDKEEMDSIRISLINLVERKLSEINGGATPPPVPAPEVGGVVGKQMGPQSRM